MNETQKRLLGKMYQQINSVLSSVYAYLYNHFFGTYCVLSIDKTLGRFKLAKPKTEPPLCILSPSVPASNDLYPYKPYSKMSFMPFSPISVFLADALV